MSYLHNGQNRSPENSFGYTPGKASGGSTAEPGTNDFAQMNMNLSKLVSILSDNAMRSQYVALDEVEREMEPADQEDLSSVEMVWQNRFISANIPFCPMDIASYKNEEAVKSLTWSFTDHMLESGHFVRRENSGAVRVVMPKVSSSTTIGAIEICTQTYNPAPYPMAVYVRMNRKPPQGKKDPIELLPMLSISTVNKTWAPAKGMDMCTFTLPPRRNVLHKLTIRPTPESVRSFLGCFCPGKGVDDIMRDFAADKPMVEDGKRKAKLAPDDPVIKYMIMDYERESKEAMRARGIYKRPGMTPEEEREVEERMKQDLEDRIAGTMNYISIEEAYYVDYAYADRLRNDLLLDHLSILSMEDMIHNAGAKQDTGLSISIWPDVQMPASAESKKKGEIFTSKENPFIQASMPYDEKGTISEDAYNELVYNTYVFQVYLSFQVLVAK